jgi:xanthine dehydrogenase molybdenum-binding subunit
VIPFDFEYYKPASCKEAVSLFLELHDRGKQPLYYSGGTEIITMARLNQVYTEAVVDIKGIPECNVLEQQGEQLVFGGAITLAQIEESGMFPLLAKACHHIADHTSRCKITLGGNICGNIMYREAVLPALLTDSEVVIAGEDGLRQVSIHEVFDQQLQVKKGEFLVQLITEKRFADQPFFCEKKTKLDKIDYPLLTLAALKVDDQIRVALSGVCAFPFRQAAIERYLNHRESPAAERVDNALRQLPAPVLDDLLGSSGYRRFVLRNTLFDALEALEGAET